jgi:hypothetical protein
MTGTENQKVLFYDNFLVDLLWRWFVHQTL